MSKTISHKVITDNFSFAWLNRAIEEELTQLIFYAKSPKAGNPDEELTFILDQLLSLRWNMLFNSMEVSDEYKYAAYISIATMLNKYGYKDETIYAKAVEGLSKIRDDEFGYRPMHEYKKADNAIAMFESDVEYHPKKPTPKTSITQYRIGDIFSIQLGKQYAVAQVKKIDRVNEAPIVEIYHGLFEQIPSIDEVHSLELSGTQNLVDGLNYLPDMAHQFKLIATIKTDGKAERMGVANIFRFVADAARINDIKI